MGQSERTAQPVELKARRALAFAAAQQRRKGFESIVGRFQADRPNPNRLLGDAKYIRYDTPLRMLGVADIRPSLS